MKITEKIKPLLGVTIILGAAVIADLTYNAVGVQAGENFDFRLPVLLFRLRPLFLVTVYTAFLIIGYPLIAQDYSDHFRSLLLIMVGLAVLYVITFQPGGYPPSTRALYKYFIILATSRLGLTLNTGAILVALGVYRLLRYRFRTRS